MLAQGSCKLTGSLDLWTFQNLQHYWINHLSDCMYNFDDMLILTFVFGKPKVNANSWGFLLLKCLCYNLSSLEYKQCKEITESLILHDSHVHNECILHSRVTVSQALQTHHTPSLMYVKLNAPSMRDGVQTYSLPSALVHLAAQEYPFSLDLPEKPRVETHQKLGCSSYSQLICPVLS